MGGMGAAIDRKNGVALWRQIADDIRAAISRGEFAAGGKLPGEMALAGRFGVNRHTVRAALAALQAEGIVKSAPGRGTEILSARRLTMPISRRTRFSSGLADQARRPESTFLSSERVAAPDAVAAALGLQPAAPCIALETLSLADGVPVSLALHYFSESRFAGIDLAFRRERSVTRALAVSGVEDYTRFSTDITARHANETERHWLKLAPGAIVLEANAVNVDMAGEPIQYSRTRFAADRVNLRVETDSV